MIRSLFGLTVLLALSTTPASALELHLKQEGIEVDAGTIGRFVFSYPAFLDQSNQTIHPIIEKTVTGDSAMLRYEGGASFAIRVAKDGSATMEWDAISADVKSVELALQIPISFNQGGRWSIGEADEAFPAQKPANPHLYQGGQTVTRITNFEGKTLEMEVPQFAFLQLSDNREWDWSIYHWKAFLPVGGLQSPFTVNFRTLGDTGETKALVDPFGQSRLTNWPDKVNSLEDLQGDVAAEQAYYANLTPPALDNYGGLPGSKESLGLEATGFFHLEKNAERWILVNPIGNAFFHLGVCGVNPNDDFTLVTGRETAYEWLPEQTGEYASIFRSGQEGTVLSFHLANQVRKYRQPFTGETYTARMIERLRKWGFNSVGAFTPLELGPEARKAAQFPTVAHLPLNFWEGIPRVPGIHETFDPFDENTRSLVAKNMANYLPAHANDPLIIGWFIVNEPIYEQIPSVVPSLKASEHACKARLVEWLEDKYKDIAAYNLAWQAQAKAFDDLLETGLPLSTKAAQEDAEAFATVFLKEYLSLVEGLIRQHAPHHLLIGSRLQPATISQEWICRAMGPHVDVMSFNYYTYELDREFLKRIYEWTGEKPMMLSEFFWSSPTDTGLTGGRELSSQQERGLAYRNYVEQAASLGFVVGIEWFTLVDQSVTGRWFSGFDGERANSGLIAVTDRPWKDMLAEAMKTNYDIYEVWLGKKAPYAWDDPRVQPKH